MKIKTVLKTTGGLALALTAFYLVISHDYDDPVEPVLPADKSGDKKRNPYIVPNGETMVSAHRSGAGIAPENTLRAFRNCVESDSFFTDVFEFDLHLTEDGELILLHDDTFDRTSNAKEAFGKAGVLPKEKTYEELYKLNMGEHFETADGKTPYAGLRGDQIPDDLHVMRLRDIFTYLAPFKNYRFIIELKDGGDRGRRAADKLYETLSEFGLLKRAVIGTFHGEISRYMSEKYPDMLRSASVREVCGFYFSSLFGIHHKPGHYRFAALQIPYDDHVFNLGTARLVNYAHKNNIAVQYWTINKPEKVRHLIRIGADAIMSDLPDMVYSVLRGKA